MTTNDLIKLIRTNHMNPDCLAQITSAIECMQEELAEPNHDEIFTHEVKVFRNGGGVDYVKCVSLEDAKVARKHRIAQGDVTCAIVGTCEEIRGIDAMFNR